MRFQSENIIKIGEVEGPGLLELSVSKVKKWRSCQQAYKYKYVDKLTPKRQAVPLRKGTWVHLCLEARDSGLNWVDVIRKLKEDEYDKLFIEEKTELGDLPMEVYRMMRAYTQTYKEIDKDYRTIICEQDFMIRVEGTPYVMTGKIDKITLHVPTNKIWCFEHKTMKNTPPTEDFRLTDIQTAIYTWVMTKLIKEGYLKVDGCTEKDIGGVMFDYIKTKPPTIPEKLKNGTISKRKIDCDWYTYKAVVEKEGFDINEYMDMKEKLEENVYFRRIPMVKSPKMVKSVVEDLVRTGYQITTLCPDHTVRNLNFTCDRPKCEYRDLCISDLMGHDVTTLIQLNYERREDNGKESEDESTD